MQAAPVTERLLRSLTGRCSAEGEGVALRPYTVPASLALFTSMLPLRPSGTSEAAKHLSALQTDMMYHKLRLCHVQAMLAYME